MIAILLLVPCRCPKIQPCGLMQTLKKVNEFKTEGIKLFVGKDYSKAIDAYEKAIKLLPDSSEVAADLYSNKAACYYQQNR